MADEPLPHRRWDDREPGLKIGWGSRYLHARGITVTFLLGVAAVVAAIVWGGEQQRRESERTREAILEHDHASAARGAAQWESLYRMQNQWIEAMRLQAHQMDVQNCIGLYDFNERRVLRGRTGWVYDACPWIPRPTERLAPAVDLRLPEPHTEPRRER